MLRIQKLRMRSSGKDEEHAGPARHLLHEHQPLGAGLRRIGDLHDETGAAPVAAKVDPPRVAGRLRAARHEGEDDSGKSRPQCAEKPGGAASPRSHVIPTPHLSRQFATRPVHDLHRHGLSGLQVRQTEPAQNLDMDEHVVRLPENIGEAKALRLVEPFDAGGVERRVCGRVGNRDTGYGARSRSPGSGGVISSTSPA